MAPAPRSTPEVNLQRVLHVGIWNILSLSEDHQLPFLSAELIRLRIDIDGLYEMRPGSGVRCTYFWSGMANRTHVWGLSVAISSRLTWTIVEVTVDEHIT